MRPLPVAGRVETRQDPARSTADEKSFAGKSALVTGASSGIGKAIAQALAARGAALKLIGRRPELLKKAVGPAHQIYEVDLAKTARIETFAREFVRSCERLDMLIHSAGVIGIGAVENSPVAQLDWQWNVNLRAPYLLTQAVLPLLKAARGQIVFINSSAGVTAVPHSSQYSATKHALSGLADSLRQEINEAGVRVLSVFVGRTATPMQAELHAREGRAYVPEKLIQPDDVASVVVHALALPGTVEVTAIHLRPMARSD